MDGVAGNAGAGCYRVGVGSAGGVAFGAFDCDAVIRTQSDRSPDVDHCGIRVDRSRSARGLHPRAPRVARRSADRVEIRVRYLVLSAWSLVLSFSASY